MKKPQPASSHPEQSRCFSVYEGQTLVLTVWDEPGSLRSTALPAPGSEGPNSRHPFIDAQAHDAVSEGELRALLLVSESFDDYLQKLLDAGFDIGLAEDLGLGPGQRIFQGQQLVGALWQGGGSFSCLAWSPERQGPPLPHAMLTAYDAGHAARLRQLATSARDYAELVASLERAGYNLKPLGR